MIYKYTKCESVIAKIMADANMSEKNMRVTDMREWIFEAVEKIGAPVQYEQRESGVDGCPIFRLEGHQIPIPEDLEALNAVAYSTSPDGPWIPVRKDDSTFKSIKPRRKLVEHVDLGPMREHANQFLEDDPDHVVVTGVYTDKHTHIPEQPMKYKQPVTTAQLYTEFNHTTDKDRIANAMMHQDATYFIKPGWIVLNKEHGFVKLQYKSIATDERGYPLIPDLASYQEAIYWYVMMKLNFPKFLNGTLGGRAKYNFNTYGYLQQQWNFYRNQAYAEAMMPNEGEMRSIKNMWHKLIPDWDADDTFFKTTGERQLNYNDYYYGY